MTNFVALVTSVIFMGLSWIFIRSFTGFDPNKPDWWYVNLKSKALANLLVDPKSHHLKYVKVKDRLKLNIPCLVGYILWFVALIVSLIFMLLPQMPCKPTVLPFSRRHQIVLDTYNVKVPYGSALLLFFLIIDAVLISLLLKIFRVKNIELSKKWKISFIALTVFLLLATLYLFFAIIR